MLGRILIGAVRGYQLLVSPWTPPACRYAPTCSAYAIEAIETHGALHGAWLAMRRISRCQPWGGHGWDPVPPPARTEEQPETVDGLQAVGGRRP